MNKNPIEENEFSVAPAGIGSVNYQTPLNTHSSPDNEQSIDKFNTVDSNHDSDSDGPNSHFTDDFTNPEDLDRAVDQIYSKKKVPTSDHVRAGLKYELGNMIKPDKYKAMEIVLSHLEKDPGYYGELNHLNINDKKMEVPVNEVLKKINEKETKKIFDSLTVKKDTKFVVNAGISEIMKGLWEARNARPKWKKGDPTF